MTPLSARSFHAFRRALLPLTLFLPVVALVPACGVHEDDAFRGGVPTSDSVQMNIPGGGARAQGALTADDGLAGARSALLGEKADYYTLTRAVTAIVNTGTYSVLTLVRTIVGYPATTVTGDTAVWGPHTEPLSPNVWRLTVTRIAEHTFDYALEARAKSTPAAPFLTILAGRHTAVVGPGGQAIEGLGNGTFTLDWETARMLPEHDNNFGKAAFTYGRQSLAGIVTVAVDFKGIKDDKTGEIFDAVYQYASTPGAGGDFQYAAHQDALPGPGPTGSAKETFTVHSRWQETGAGRSDVKIAGGDVPAAQAPVTVNECWDENFLSQYRNLSYDPASSWGQESSCVFVTASYSALN
jgi:hypothetical protein